MALGTFVPGRYTATYNSVTLGIVENGYTLRYRFHERSINQTSHYGDSKIDGIYRGGDCFMVFTVKEWTANIRAMLWPWVAQSTVADWGKFGQIAQLASAVAKVLVLTPQSSSPADTAGAPLTFTANLSKFSPENDANILMGPDQRDVPIMLDLLPFNDGSVDRWFTIT